MASQGSRPRQPQAKLAQRERQRFRKGRAAQRATTLKVIVRLGDVPLVFVATTVAR